MNNLNNDFPLNQPILNRNSFIQTFQNVQPVPNVQMMQTQLNPSTAAAANPLSQLNQINQLNNSNFDLYCLENFICPLNSKDSIKSYCNACCSELFIAGLEDHLKSNKHFLNRKRLNNKLLAVNLFQISKHCNQQLTDSLKRSFVSYDSFKAVKEIGTYFNINSNSI